MTLPFFRQLFLFFRQSLLLVGSLLPPTKVEQKGLSAVADIASQPYRLDAWWGHARQLARQLETAQVDDLLATMVYPPGVGHVDRPAAWVYRVQVAVLTGRVASDDEEAFRAIGGEMRDLLDGMDAGIAKFDAKAIREAANRAKGLAAMLEPGAQAKMQAKAQGGGKDAGTDSAEDAGDEHRWHQEEIERLVAERRRQQRPLDESDGDETEGQHVDGCIWPPGARPMAFCAGVFGARVEG